MLQTNFRYSIVFAGIAVLVVGANFYASITVSAETPQEAINRLIESIPLVIRAGVLDDAVRKCQSSASGVYFPAWKSRGAILVDGRNLTTADLKGIIDGARSQVGSFGQSIGGIQASDVSSYLNLLSVAINDYRNCRHASLAAAFAYAESFGGIDSAKKSAFYTYIQSMFEERKKQAAVSRSSVDELNRLQADWNNLPAWLAQFDAMGSAIQATAAEIDKKKAEKILEEQRRQQAQQPRRSSDQSRASSESSLVRYIDHLQSLEAVSHSGTLPRNLSELIQRYIAGARAWMAALGYAHRAPATPPPPPGSSPQPSPPSDGSQGEVPRAPAAGAPSGAGQY